MKSDACLHLLDFKAAEQHRDWCNPLTDLTWQQPVGFVAVSDAGLTSVAIIPSLGLAPFALAAPIQAPLAPQLSYASVAKSAAYQAVSGQNEQPKKKIALLWMLSKSFDSSNRQRNGKILITCLE